MTEAKVGHVSFWHKADVSVLNGDMMNQYKNILVTFVCFFLISGCAERAENPETIMQGSIRYVNNLKLITSQSIDGVESISCNDLEREVVAEGGVRFTNDEVLITVRRIDGRTGDTIWSTVYSRSYSDRAEINAIQTEIAENIVRELGADSLPCGSEVAKFIGESLVKKVEDEDSNSK